MRMSKCRKCGGQIYNFYDSLCVWCALEVPRPKPIINPKGMTSWGSYGGGIGGGR